MATVLCVALPACNEQQWKSHSLEVGEPRLWAPSAGWWSLTRCRYIISILWISWIYCGYIVEPDKNIYIVEVFMLCYRDVGREMVLDVGVDFLCECW